MRENDENADSRRIIPIGPVESSGERMVRNMRGCGTATDTAGMTTGELMELLRGED